MKTPPTPRTLAARTVLLTLLVPSSLIVGCGSALEGILLPNQRPTITLVHAPASTTEPYSYAYRMEWFAQDPDGFVAHFEYAVDPAPGDTGWVRTQESEVTLILRSDEVDPTGASGEAMAFHVFLVRAIDGHGLGSAPAQRAFFTRTVAPFVQITTPAPQALVSVSLSPSIAIRWSGRDPDGATTDRPVKYKYILLSSSSPFPQSLALSNPDSLRRYYAPDFAGWDSTDADHAEARYTNLTPDASYVFAVVAFDEAGAYSPIFSLDGNMLRFTVKLAATAGPRFTIFNNYINYTFPSGGWTLDPRAELSVEALPGGPVDINWYATPSPGSTLLWYRWRLDGDVSDETPREDELTDIGRWSTPALLTQGARVGPFDAGEEHRLYIEAADNLGLRSLAVVAIRILGSAFSKDLLIVDDTRFVVDELGPGGCIRTPTGLWPTASELDTFLYARGDVPYRCLPQGVTSSPGLFSGYAFDTLGTRDVPFSFTTLTQYRHVVWIVDALSALQDGRNTRTSLRVMNGPGVLNTLAAYSEQGGKLWLLGGGIGYAAMINYDVSSNNGTTPTFSSTAGELVPQRFFYDATGWRSEFKAIRSGVALWRSDRAVGGWPGAPNYTLLPQTIVGKTALTDPIPPTRMGQSPTIYYRTFFDFEFLSQPNHVIEDADPDPVIVDSTSTLDTLYRAVGLGLPGPAQNPENVVMTLYRNPGHAPVVMTGFDLWHFRRDQCSELVDVVLQEIWGLRRRAGPP